MSDITSFSPLWGVWAIVKQIGAGTFGDVYEAKRVERGREYVSAIKHISIPPKGVTIQTLRADGTVTDEASAYRYCQDLLDALSKEIDLCYELKGHTNFVSYEDHMIVPRQGALGYDVFIRMELLTTLPDYISEHGITVGGITKLCEDMCTALDVLGQKRLIHRDIKPANIFVSAAGDFKLGDFGVARHMEGLGSMSVKGTYNYMAPEILKGGLVGTNSDLYSLGLVLYRLLNDNRAPFLPPPPARVGYQENQDALEKRLSGLPLPVPSRAELSLALTNVVMRVCEYDPGRRFQSAAEMKRALLDFRGSAPRPAPGFAAAGIDPDATIAIDRSASWGTRPSAGAGSAQWSRAGGGLGSQSGYGASGTGYPPPGRPAVPPYAQGAAARPANSSNKTLIAVMVSVVGVIAVMLAVILILVLPKGAGTGTAAPAGAQEPPSAAPATAAPQTATPVPTPTPTPAPEPVITEEDFNAIADHISGKWIGVTFVQADIGYRVSASSSTMSISALVCIPILYTVVNHYENGWLSQDSTLSYINSGGRGAGGQLYQSRTGAQVKVSALISDMLTYSSNGAFNTLIDYFGGEIDEVCHSAGFRSVEVNALVGRGDNYASPDDLAGMLEEIWNGSYRYLLRDHFNITDSDANANVGLTNGISTSLSVLNCNGFKDTVYSEASILYDPRDESRAYITVFVGNGSGKDYFAPYASWVGKFIAGSCG